MRIRVHLHDELVPVAGTGGGELPSGTPRSVKDAVEAVGVPHPEVGLLVVDGAAVGFDHLLTGGEQVAVYPPFHDLGADSDASLWPEPPEPRRFVLDVHLGTLARRLRLLGFDAWYRTDAEDQHLAQLAVAEERILLTRDRGLLKRAEIVHGYCPRSDDPEDQAIEVVRRYSLAVRRAPLTRCVRCNGVLAPVPKSEVLYELPPRTREAFDEFARCRSCGRVYWPGTHVEAVDAFLLRAARA